MTFRSWLAGIVCLTLSGCATMKESDTARTGVEQLLISSSVDRALNKIDFRPISHAKVYIEPKYLDCVDKNYVLVAVHQRLLHNGCTLVEKAEESDVTLEIGSGAVGTDRQELFVGIPEIPLPPPSRIAIPRLAIFTRTKAMGTAKLSMLAYDTKTRLAVINTGYTLARADHKNWNVMGLGGQQSGSVHDELVAATGEVDSVTAIPAAIARGATQMAR